MSTQLEKNDILLNLLVKIAETNASISVTLNVNGTIITGDLISQKRYYEEVVSNIRESFENTFKEESAGILDSLSMFGDFPNGSSCEEDGTAEYAFVHLSGAQFFSGGNRTPSNGAPWRGKLTAIDGFILGRIS